MSIDDEFNMIALRTSAEAAGVRCTTYEYRYGLKQIIETLQIDIQASKEAEDASTPEDPSEDDEP